MAEEPIPVREYYVAGIAVPVGEIIGLRIVIEHENIGNGPQWSTVTVNIGLDDDVFAVLNRAMIEAGSGLFTAKGYGTQLGAVKIGGIQQVVIGGFDQPNMTL